MKGGEERRVRDCCLLFLLWTCHQFTKKEKSQTINIHANVHFNDHFYWLFAAVTIFSVVYCAAPFFLLWLFHTLTDRLVLGLFKFRSVLNNSRHTFFPIMIINQHKWLLFNLKQAKHHNSILHISAATTWLQQMCVCFHWFHEPHVILALFSIPQSLCAGSTSAEIAAPIEAWNSLLNIKGSKRLLLITVDLCISFVRLYITIYSSTPTEVGREESHAGEPQSCCKQT